jgi:3-hydroxyisobutyrate dehydrogenase-like beta-hydroxyacid dehydrogenase
MRPDPTAIGRDAIGFIGLGALGAPMAANLLNAGFPLTLHNRSRQREAFLLERGAAAAANPAEVARRSSILCLCLSDDAAVEAVLFEDDGAAGNGASKAAIHGLQPGSLLIDFSTISPATTRRLAERLEAAGVAWLDAPVTGGTEGARAGTLSVLVGGEAADLERARPLLEVIGGRITHLGPLAAGQQAKAVNQVLVAGSYGAVAEALALGQRLGLPMEQLVEALQDGAAGSWALTHRSGHMLNGQHPLGFRLALHRKDLAIALSAASEVDLELPLSQHIAALEDELIARGHGDEDVSALARWFRPAGEGPAQYQP